jgi:transaldolase
MNKLKIKIFADGADKAGMLEMNSRSYIQGLTTNPTLMKKAGVTNYKEFCIDILSTIKQKPLSFEVFSDDFLEMERQANEIASWGDNIYVKIPITNTKGEPCTSLVKNLTRNKIKVNVTALMTLDQVASTMHVLDPAIPSYVSVFAGRIADTGVDPVPVMAKAVEMLKPNASAELIWASPRELINVFQADEIGCHIITATNDIINKLKMVGYDLDQYSLDTVKMFFEDAKLAGYSI